MWARLNGYDKKFLEFSFSFRMKQKNINQKQIHVYADCVCWVLFSCILLVVIRDKGEHTTHSIYREMRQNVQNDACRQTDKVSVVQTYLCIFIVCEC